VRVPGVEPIPSGRPCMMPWVSPDPLKIAIPRLVHKSTTLMKPA
jgi:hypothetical protein